MPTLKCEDFDTSLNSEEKPAIKLVRRLLQSLNSEGVVYCHWKSNAALHLSASGDNDLDLLINTPDGQLFNRILLRLMFWRAHPAPGQQVPGIEDYYGYDRDADKLVHVHAHYQLVLGDDMTKNYRLPVEKQYLDSATRSGLFRIPEPEFELILLVIRMVLKHCAWDAAISGRGHLPTAARHELHHLQSLADYKRVHEILLENLPCLEPALFDRCLKSLRPDSSVVERIMVAYRMQRALQSYARRSQTRDSCLKLWRRAGRLISRRVFGRGSRKRLGDGTIIAIVGGDGAGKSTLVESLYSWLEKDFQVIKVHMGKPPWSLATVLVRGILKLGRLLGLFPFSNVPAQGSFAAPSSLFPGYPSLIREVCAARDRYLSYRRAGSFAGHGGLVICDRFPLAQVKLMDGPQVHRLAAAKADGRLVKYLMRLERRYYQPIVPPDLLIVLRVDPDIAVRRKTDEDPASVRTRSQEIWDLDWQQTEVSVFDASLQKEQILSEAKSLVWSRLNDNVYSQS